MEIFERKIVQKVFIVIQELSLSQYPDVLELWEKVGLNPRVEGRDHPDFVKDQLETGNVVLLGKIIDNKLIGAVLVSHDERKGWINRLAVNPANQKQGIGKELLTAAEEYLLTEKKIEVISALIFNDNIASKQCFKSNGYINWEEVCYFSKRVRPES
jgi:RimJ/RimL family protein N-acetyltransferase